MSSKNRSIEEPFEPSNRELFYSNDALEELDRFSRLVDSYIHFYAERIAKNRVNDPNKDVTIENGDVIEAVDCLRFQFGKEFFELTEGKWQI